MQGTRHGFWHRPSWAHLRRAILLGLGVTTLFAIVYGGTDWFTRQHTYRVTVHCAVDLQIPLIPAAVTLYLSLNVLFWITPFVLRTTRELEALALSLSFAIIVAGTFFLVLPAADAFSENDEAVLGPWATAFHVARALALHYNYFPSLHVAFTVICIWPLAGYASKLGKSLLFAWGAGIITSTMLTHQHYLFDVASGLVLGLVALQQVYARWIARNANPIAIALPASPASHREPPV